MMMEPPIRFALFGVKAMRQIAVMLGALALFVSMVALAGWDTKMELPSALLAAIVCLLFIGGYFVMVKGRQVEWEWLMLLTYSAFLIRLAFAVGIYFFAPDRNYLAEDQVGYDIMPQWLMNYWFGNGPRPEYLYSGFRGITRIGYLGMVAIQYWIFDVSFVVPRVFNCMAGAFLALYAFRITQRTYGLNAAKIAGVLTAFFPSLILWSSLNMRDIWIALAIVIIAWHAVLLRDKMSISSIVVIAGCLMWIQMNRAYLVPIMGLTVAGSFIFGRAREWYKDLLILSTMLMAVAAVLYFFQVGSGMEFVDLEAVNRQRLILAKASVGKSGYLGDIDISNPVNMIIYSPLLLAYFLFSPFPWDIRGVRQLLTLPEMIVWYACIPFVIMTIVDTFKDKTRKGFTLLMPMVIITISFALSSGNMGLSYRYRAQVVTLFLIFAAAGFAKWRVGKILQRNPQIMMLIQQIMAQRATVGRRR